MIGVTVSLVLALMAFTPSQGHDHGWGQDSGKGWGSSGWNSAGGSNGGRQTTASPVPAVRADKRSLDDIQKACLAQGGRVIVYAGGDTPSQQDNMRDAFVKRFPKVKMDMIVDFSKRHDGRIDYQLATKTLVPDVTQLQTLQDFPRWKKAGVLLQYKPVGWDAIYPQFKDADGFYTGIFVDAFSNLVNKNLLRNNATWPTEANDYLRPEFKGKIATTYPNDDDAVLFWFKLVIDKYGYSWAEKFKANDPILLRSTQYPPDYVFAGKAVATFTTDGLLVPGADDPAIFVLPKSDPFMSWPQTAAIFKNSSRQECGKLYLSWLLDIPTQRDIWYQWSVRKDVPPKAGYKSIFDYPNTDPTAFGKWMQDREAVEQFRTEMTLLYGEAQGVLPPGNLGLHPQHQLQTTNG